MVFRSELKIIETGEKLKELYPAGPFIGQSFTFVIKMRRPKLSLTWENVYFKNHFLVIELNLAISHIFKKDQSSKSDVCDQWCDDNHDGATHENADRTHNGLLPDQYRVGGEVDRGEPVGETWVVETVDEVVDGKEDCMKSVNL